MTQVSEWVQEQVERIKSTNPGATVHNRGDCTYVHAGVVVHCFEDSAAAPRFHDCWVEAGDDNEFETALTLSVEFDGVLYTTEKNWRYPERDFWTLLADGKPFATIEAHERYGWRGTFSISGLSRCVWVMTEGCGLIERVEKMHEGHKDFLSRCEVV
jgi:hypothetical protein